MILRHNMKTDSQNATPFVNEKSESRLAVSVDTAYGDFPKEFRKIPKNPEKSKILKNNI